MNLPNVAVPKVTQNLENSSALSLATPIGAIVICLLVAVFVVWPKFADIRALRAANEELVQRIENLKTKASTLSSLDKNTLESQLAAAELMLPSNKDAFLFLRQIENFAGASGILVNKIDVVPGSINDNGAGGGGASVPAASAEAAGSSTSVVKGVAPSVQVTISVTSTYQSLLDFISRMYSGSRVSVVDDLGVSNASGTEAQVRANFTLEGYWKPLPLELGSIEKPIVKLTDKEAELLRNVSEKGTSGETTLPEVPLGRGDLFAPL